MSVYSDLFEARFNELQREYRHANEGRGYARPSALRSLIQRIKDR